MVKAWKPLSVFAVVALISLLAPAAVLVEPEKTIAEPSLGVMRDGVGRKG